MIVEKVVMPYGSVDQSPFTEEDIIKDQSEVNPIYFEEGFQQKYKDNKYFVYESVVKDEGSWARFKQRLVRLYERLFGFRTSEEANDALDWTINILSVLLIVFVIYLIVKAILNDEGSWAFGRSSDKKIIQYDQIEQNIHTVDFERLIHESEKNAEQRLTIRYYYLWLLKLLSEKEIIEWDIEKTNSDYQNEIQDTTLKSNFSYLSYLYDYIWYGEFDIDQPTFDKAKAAFDTTIQKLKR